MSPVELLAVVFSLASVVLAARRHVGTWPAGIVGVAAYFVVFIGAKLYADAALQVVFLLQCAYGWVHWTQRPVPKAGELPAGTSPIVTLDARQRLLVALAVGGGAAVVGSGLARFTDAASPYLDATVAVMSLAANWLLARRVLENWALWVAADVLYVALFASKGLLLSAGLYALFMLLAAAGWRAWWRSLRAPASEPSAECAPRPTGAAA